MTPFVPALSRDLSNVHSLAIASRHYKRPEDEAEGAGTESGR